MRKALTGLLISPGHVLVDGRGLPELTIPQTPIIKGDQKCFSIAAASIIAKVTRDQIMMTYDAIFPGYGFAQNKGYGTRQHIQAIRKLGYCDIHRRSFKIRGWQNHK
jgi:ribonuclease HII